MGGRGVSPVDSSSGTVVNSGRWTGGTSPPCANILRNGSASGASGVVIMPATRSDGSWARTSRASATRLGPCSLSRRCPSLRRSRRVGPWAGAGGRWSDPTSSTRRRETATVALPGVCDHTTLTGQRPGTRSPRCHAPECRSADGVARWLGAWSRRTRRVSGRGYRSGDRAPVHGDGQRASCLRMRAARGPARRAEWSRSVP